MSDTPEPTSSHGERLGDILRETRTQKGLELSDIAEKTHVRKSYLEALEAGRFEELPEEVYTKNFLRLYAQTIGLDEARVLQLYYRERPREGHSTLSEAHTAAGELEPGGPERSRAPRRAAPWLGGWLAMLVLVVVLVGAAVWAFNTFLFNPSAARVSTNEPQAPAAAVLADEAPEAPAPEGAGEAVAAVPAAAEDAPLAESGTQSTQGQILLSVTSIPEGAEVSIDNYALPRTTPVVEMPVTAGESRILRVSLPGYLPFEQSFDMTFDRNLSVALTPVPPPAAPAGAETPPTSDEAPQAATPATEQGQISLVIEEASWLEVYAGTGRGQGRTLLYRTVQPGDSFVFDLPVYLHVGNAGGVRYAMNGQARGLLGSSGEVISRMFR